MFTVKNLVCISFSCIDAHWKLMHFSTIQMHWKTCALLMIGSIHLYSSIGKHFILKGFFPSFFEKWQPEMKTSQNEAGVTRLFITMCQVESKDDRLKNVVSKKSVDKQWLRIQNFHSSMVQKYLYSASWHPWKWAKFTFPSKWCSVASAGFKNHTRSLTHNHSSPWNHQHLCWLTQVSSLN